MFIIISIVDNIIDISIWRKRNQCYRKQIPKFSFSENMIPQHYLPLHTYLHIFADKKGNLYFKISSIVKHNIKGVIRGGKKS